MKFYLSSYKIGNESDSLVRLLGKEKPLAYIPNALDFIGADPDRRNAHIKNDMNSLKALGINVELLDLKNYFKKKKELNLKLKSLGGVFISGGNVFVLRQAMKLSGFDEIFNELLNRKNFLYSGYSAGCCVLSKSLEIYSSVDNPHVAYDELNDVIWDGLGYLNYIFLPHFDSEHKESKMVDEEIKKCIKDKILFKAIRDGEVIILE